MRPFRRPPHPERPVDGAVVHGALPLAPEESALFAGEPGSVLCGDGPALVPATPVDLVATQAGVVVGSSTGSPRAVPSLIPWSAVAGAGVSHPALLPDGTVGRVVVVELSEGSRPEDAALVRYVLPTTDVAPFLRAVSFGIEGWAAESGTASPTGRRVTALAAGARAATTGWATSLRLPGGEPRHGLGKRRVGPIAVGLLALLLLAGSGRAFESSVSGAAQGSAPAHAQDVGNGLQASRVHGTVNLPMATSTPAPAPPSLAGAAPLQSHEIFGYAPYWTLPQSARFDVANLTTLAYFSVDANANGTLNQSGSGWNGYESQDLVNLVTRSHAAGDRVVLTVTCFSQSSLDAITSDPSAPARLSAALIAAVSAKNLDGVNFDFEGQGSGDRHGLTSLITQVSAALHAANPHWQVTMATYASAASDGAGFYDVAALAPAVDGFFVMAYDMNSRSVPSATAPLVGGGYSDAEALQQFTAVVPAQKVILGVPYYGYDWPTTDGTRTAQATGGESPLSDGVITSSGHPTYWDPATQTPWTAYQVGTQWHETFFDDPTSLALKAQLANSFHIAGLGIWALGMDGNDPANLAALLGNAPPSKDYQTGPTVTLPPGTGFATTAVWNGATVPLTPVTPPASDGTAQFVGTVTGITTNAPALACLQSGPPLNVWTFSTMPGVDVVVAVQPADCAQAMFTFVPPPPSTSTTTSTTTTSTTTTTTAPPTTTTSTTAPPSTSTTTSTSTTGP
jgi:spore germination protein YaaH